MKRSVPTILLFAAMAAASPAWAQGTPAAPATDAADAPKAAVPYKTVEPKVVADYPLPSSQDPRVCLEFATTAQIIACAEKYRPHRRRA